MILRGQARSLLWVFGLLAWSTFLQARIADSLIGADDLLKIKQLSSPSISPDSSRVVYVVRSIEEVSGHAGEYLYRSRIWTVAVDGHAGARPLTRADANAWAPAWSPQGDRVAFIRSDGNLNRIWVMPTGAAGGEPYPITKPIAAISGLRWSPTGDRLLFTAAVTLAQTKKELENASLAASHPWSPERPGRPRAEIVGSTAKNSPTPTGTPAAIVPQSDGTLPEIRAWLDRNEIDRNPRVLTRLEFEGEGDLEPTEDFTHIYVVNAEEGATPQLLTPGFFSAEDPCWVKTPAGLAVVCSGAPGARQHPDWIEERDLWLLSLDHIPPRKLLHENHLAITSPRASPDHQHIAFLAEDLSQDGFGQINVGTVSSTGENPHILTAPLDRNANNPTWSPDGKFIYFTATSNGGVPLFRVPAKGGNVERLTGFGDGIRSLDISSAQGVVVLSNPGNPCELYRISPSGKDFHLLTAHNGEWLQAKSLSPLEHREIARADGSLLDVWLVKPAMYEGGKYPLLVEIHGGPQTMWGPGDASMWHEFQFFAARGYGLVFCNPRGSGGYGQRFQREVFQNWGPGPTADVLEAVDLASKETWVDPDREVITGGSYGGYLTAWIIAHDHRFKAAIAQRGLYELSVFFGEGNAWRLIPRHFGGYPWQPKIRRILDEQSPLTYASDIQTPLLIKHGDADYRTGVAQSEMLYRTLKILGKPVEYVRYPHATHEMSRIGDPRQRIDRLVRFDEFFQRFIGKNPQ